MKSIAISFLTTLQYMNIITPLNNPSVSLKQLIPQHDSLKLLILHTPFPIDISTLSHCFNLVKLDLSKNNIKSFPFLGHLTFLKIIFIHQNLLDLQQFINIFQQNGEKSILSDNIVWITYWGNKNIFFARHFAVNRTQAIAFDKNMVVQEEKIPTIIPSKTCFSNQTDITEIFLKKNGLNNYSTQQEYMQDFWLTLRILRSKYEKLNPIIKIQKIYRGWIFRLKVKRQYFRERNNYISLKECFKQWKRLIKNKAKLVMVLTIKRKMHLLYSNGRITRQQIYQRMRDMAISARRKVSKRRLLLEHQIRFYSILRGNYLAMQQLYTWLRLEQSTSIYIYRDHLPIFMKYVLPFTQQSSNLPIVPTSNQTYHLHYLHQSASKYQFINFVKNIISSVVSFEKPMQKMLQIIKFKKPTYLDNKLKAVFGKFHVSKDRKDKMAEQQRKIEEIKRYQMDQLVKIPGSYQLLKTIVRGVFFHNSNRLRPQQSQKIQKITLFSQIFLKRISSAVSIQRAWKGYIFRKKHHSELKIILKYQKAAIYIQRWFRRLPASRKKLFLFQMTKKWGQFEQNCFYVDYYQYRQQISLQEVRKDKYIFLQQHAQIYKNKNDGKIFVTWDDESSRLDINTMVQFKRPLFTKIFLQSYFSSSYSQIAERLVYISGKLIKCNFANLFHYHTQTHIIQKGDKKYLQIICKDKIEARFRILALSLLSYNFKEKRPMGILKASNFLKSEISSRIQIGIQQPIIICNQNIQLIKVIQQSCSKYSDIGIYIISNKIFLQFDQDHKPFRVQQQFFIYMLGFRPESHHLPQQKQHVPFKMKIHNASLADLSDLTTNEDPHIRQSSNLDSIRVGHERRILVRKRSIKQFNAKRNRIKDINPHFIIDNKLSARPSQNQSHLVKSSQRLSEKQQQLKGINKSSLQKSESDNVKFKSAYLQQKKRKQHVLKKQQDTFTKRFINLGNFMQNQFLNDYRRRIKTEAEQAAYQSASQVRKYEQRSSDNKQYRLLVRHQKARYLEDKHRELLQKNRVIEAEKQILKKNNILNYSQLSKKEKSSVRKPKVSFAEESFPLIFSKQRNLSVL